MEQVRRELEKLVKEQEKTSERMWEVLGQATGAAAASDVQNRATADTLKRLDPVLAEFESFLKARRLKEERKAALLKPVVLIPLCVLALAAFLTLGGYLTWTAVTFDVPGVIIPSETPTNDLGRPVDDM